MIVTNTSWGLVSAMTWDGAISRGSPRAMLWNRTISRGKCAATNGKKGFNKFLHVSLGSVSELETQILISRRRGYLNQKDTMLHQIEKVRKLLLGLIKHLRRVST